MPRLPGCLLKFIQKKPLEVFILLLYVRKLKRCSQKFLTKFTRKTPVLESLFKNLLKKRLWRSCFPVSLAKLLRTPFSQNTSWSLGDCCFFLLIFLPPSFYLFVASQLQVPYTHCVCFTTQLFFMIAIAIFPVFYFLLLKQNLFPALYLCSVLPFLLPTERCQTLSLIDRKVRDIIFEAILSPLERYQNIQGNPEYNSVLPFRIILKNFAVNMLYEGSRFSIIWNIGLKWIERYN